jgi:hypothetical protein
MSVVDETVGLTAGCVKVGSLVNVGEALAKAGCAVGLAVTSLARGRSAVGEAVEVRPARQPEIIKVTPNIKYILMRSIDLFLDMKTSLT